MYLTGLARPFQGTVRLLGAIIDPQTRLGDIRITDSHRVGPKVARLGHLAAEGWTVPDGYAVTADALAATVLGRPPPVDLAPFSPARLASYSARR